MKKKQWEPETWSAVLYKTRFGTYSKEQGGYFVPIPARILREKDYQRLLKLARKAKRTP